MSTRKGNVIWLEDVIKLGLQRAKELALDTGAEIQNEHEIRIKENKLGNTKDEIIQKIAIGALKWNDLKRDAMQDIAFDWDDILNMNGNSGPYMQYTYARANSVLSKVQSSEFRVQSLKFEINILVHEERDLLRCLVRFEDVLLLAAKRYAPNVLCSYLYEIAQMFNLFYQKCQILKADEEIRNFRLTLTEGVKVVLACGLNILGIETLERM